MSSTELDRTAPDVHLIVPKGDEVPLQWAPPFDPTGYEWEAVFMPTGPEDRVEVPLVVTVTSTSMSVTLASARSGRFRLVQKQGNAHRRTLTIVRVSAQ